MRKVFAILASVLLTASVFAQSPEKMSYQAVIRNSNDALVTDAQVGMQISILQGSESGNAVYIETQTPITNANGLVTIEIGTGTTSAISDDFTNIDWANGPYFIKTETDPTGETNYTITATSQLLSVPYALHAKTAETVAGGITETDPVFSDWNKDYNDLTGAPTNVSDFTNDAGYITEFTETDPSVPTGTQAGEMQYWDGSEWVTIEATTNEGATLQMIDGVPTWTGGTPITVPDAPTIDTVTAEDGQATVTYTAPANDGGSTITSYTATSSPDGITETVTQEGSGTITVTGLTNGTDYTFTVTATNDIGTSEPSAASNSVTPDVLAIGDSYQGGVVAYIFQPDDPGYVEGETHGLIAAASDLAEGIGWGCYSTPIPGADGTELGTGSQNTSDIVARCSDDSVYGIAAKTCTELEIEGYSDWFLPSKDELNKIYINQDAIGGFDMEEGVSYWSSTEFDSNEAWRQSFQNGFQGEKGKNYDYRIRPVRYF